MRRNPLQAACVTSCLALAMASGACADARAEELCPHVVAWLSKVPGNLDSTTTAQRVEVRRCPSDIRPDKGFVQLVAWRKGDNTPALIYEPEDSGFYQMVMIEGVYVFEFLGGQASRTVAIVFENGNPKIGMEDSSRYKTMITSESSRVVVEVWDSDDIKRRYEFKRTDSGARR